MFVRSKPNKSGSFSIQIISKIGGSYKVVESVGVAKNSSEISYYKKLAEDRIIELSPQLQFNFKSSEDAIIENYLHSDLFPEVKNVGPELIVGKIFNNIGFDAIDDDLFRHITLSRLFYPVSKLKTVEYLWRHHSIDIEISSVYRFMDKFYDTYSNQVEQIVYNHSKKVLGKIGIVFYDMTTLYFETDDEDDLRKIGYSKDGKFNHPQIMLGLLVGDNGYPIGYEVFEGNKYEGDTLIPIIKNIQKKYDLQKPVIVADSGLLSKSNISRLTESGYEYIIGARIKNETKSIKEQILKKATTIDENKYKIIKKEDCRLVITYSEKRAKKDGHNRKKGIKRLEKTISSGKLTKDKINNRGYNKFLKLKDKVIVEVDNEKIAEDEKWDGLKGYITNCKMSSKKIVEHYSQLWKIEKAFRISKTDLRVRPIYHRNQKRIKAHISIVFAAYAVFKELERILILNNIKISPAKAIELAKTIYTIKFTLPDSKNKIEIFNKIDNIQKMLIDMK